MAQIDKVAADLLTKLPTGQLTLASFMPVLGEAVKQASNIAMSGHDKKALVLKCLKMLATKLPFPESMLMPIMIDDVAPVAIDRLITLAKSTQTQVSTILTRPKTVPVKIPKQVSQIGRKYCLRAQPADSRDKVFKSATVQLPSKVDLSQQTLPALDQGQLGSCSANAAAVILRYLLRKEKVADYLPSRLFIYYNTRVNVEHAAAGDDCGAVLRDVAKALATYHDCPEQYWPYDIKKFSVAPSAIAVAKANTHKKLTYEAVPQDLNTMKACLAAGFPIQIGIQVFESFESDEVATTGKVPMPDQSKEQCLGGHSLLSRASMTVHSVSLYKTVGGPAGAITGFVTYPTHTFLMQT